MTRILHTIVYLEIFVHLLSSRCQALCLGVYGCTCETQAQGIVINCRGSNLDQVPVFQNDNPSLLYIELTLQDNKIQHINNAAFANLRLQRLLLSGNPILSMSDGAFDGLEADLTELIFKLEPEADFPTAAIQPLKQLQIMGVFGYGKPSLPTGAFSSLTNLQALAWTSSSLRNLSATDFISQQSQLYFLDLSLNRFTEIPVAAINSLKHLSTLDLNVNSITSIKSGSFSNLSELLALDLSRNSLQSIEPAAFAGLESTLKNLTMQSCHLDNEHLLSVKLLRTLIHLDLGGNSITSIDGILGHLKSIQVLNLARNRITSVTRSVYRILSNSLQLLDLSGNPITAISSDAFVDLNQLQELYLDGALGLQLDASSFQAQQNTLKLLSLRKANLSLSQWTSINNLTGLHTLWMSECEMGNIPDFIFHVTNQLENLDLAGNKITAVTQRSLTGLENSLVRLYLSRNQLTTLDECVFHGFTKIDILKLQLNFNPLQCDCSMKWLHLRVQELKNNPNTTLLAHSLRWTCDNGRLFNNLTAADFAHCMPTTMACEELVTSQPATIPVVTTLSTTSMDGGVKTLDSSKLPVILGVTLGVGLPLILSVIAIIVIMVWKKSGRKGNLIVHSGDQTKRFIKPNDLSRANSLNAPKSNSPGPTQDMSASSNDVIAHTIETMSDEEKFRLVNLLTNSRGSVECLSDVISLPNQIRTIPYSEQRHIYEEIPESYYDEIQPDETV